MPDHRIDVTRAAFEQLMAQTHVHCSRALKRHLVLDRLRGHAERGKGTFEGLRMTGLPVEWFCEAVGWNPSEMKEQKLAYANSVLHVAENAAKVGGMVSLCDERGQALLGIGFLRWISVDSRELLTGLYLGGMRDYPPVRAEVDRLYRERLGANGHHTHSSDDGAIVAGGMMFGFGAACGVWLADALDSMEKLLPEPVDADYLLALKIKSWGTPLLCDDADLYSLTYICTIPENQRGVIPDCSLREMLTVDPVTDQTALESHLLAAAGRPYSPMPLQDGELSNRDLYDWVRARVEDERRRKR